MADARKPRRRLIERLRADFLTGLVVVLPVGLTLMLVRWAIGFVDRRTLPLLPGALGETQIAGLGVLVFVGVTVLVGAFTRGLIGRGVVRFGEGLVGRVPLVRSVYLGAKQLVETVLRKGGTSFRRTCLIEYPDRGLWTLVFIAGAGEGEIPLRTGEPDLVAVLLPTAPNPLTGWLFYVPRRDIRPLDISFEDGAKLAMSAGLVGPK